MKFTTPATTNPIDQLKVVGRPVDRIDGPLKTSGTAPYAYEQHEAAPNAAYGYVVGAAIAKGRIASIDMAEAASARPACSPSSPPKTPASLARASSTPPSCLAGPEIQHYHQAVALVVAETFEQARAAAQLVRVKYDKEAARTTWRRPKTPPSSRKATSPIRRSATSPAPSPRRRSSSTPATPRPTSRTR